jgi:hypothetical protein
MRSRATACRFITAVILAGASQPAGCANHAPKVQDTNIQDVSTFPRCADDQGRGPAHPCTTGSDAAGWIVWVVGVADCPAKTQTGQGQGQVPERGQVTVG